MRKNAHRVGACVSADATNVRSSATNARAGAMNVTTATNTTVGGWTMCSAMDVISKQHAVLWLELVCGDSDLECM